MRPGPGDLGWGMLALRHYMKPNGDVAIHITYREVDITPLECMDAYKAFRDAKRFASIDMDNAWFHIRESCGMPMRPIAAQRLVGGSSLFACLLGCLFAC